MNTYLDTSVVVAALVPELGSGMVRAWLEDQPAGSLVVSDWVQTELSSALSLKLRTGQIDLGQRIAAMNLFHRLVVGHFQLAPVDPVHFRIAAAYADRHELGLRAPDALHLAVSADHGATLATLDRKMAMAGPALGLSTRLL